MAETFKAGGYKTAIFADQGVVLKRQSFLQGFDVYPRTDEPQLADKALEFIDGASDTPASPDLAHGPSTVFAIRRFDRAEDGTRVHQEDFAQVDRGQ